MDRRRTSQLVFFETRYSFSPKWPLIANINFARHIRDVGINNSPGVSTNGLGDGMLSIQYTPIRFSLKSKTELSIGGGVNAFCLTPFLFISGKITAQSIMISASSEGDEIKDVGNRRACSSISLFPGWWSGGKKLFFDGE